MRKKLQKKILKPFKDKKKSRKVLVAETIPPLTKNDRIAAIDMGSNSIHLAVMELNNNGTFKVLDRLKDQTRLADSIDSQQMLTEKAFVKVVSVLQTMSLVAKRHNANVRAIATHSLRVAKNGGQFAQRLKNRTGVPVEIVSGLEEARLVYLAVQNALPVLDKSVLILDIGGGSAEFLIGNRGEESFAASLKLGCVHLTSTFLKSPILKIEEIQALQDYVTSRVLPVARDIQKIGFDSAIGTSGTVKAIKMVALGLLRKRVPAEFNGVRLSIEEIEKVRQAVTNAKTLKDRLAIPGLDAKRADVIIAGVIVLHTISKIVGIQEWTVSTSALREGIVIDSIRRKKSWLTGDANDVRWRSVRGFAKRFNVDEGHAWHVVSLATGMFNELKNRHHLPDEWREYLRAAAYLHECGVFENQSSFHKHGYYFIRNADLFGFTQRELIIIASIVRYHRKRLPRPGDEGIIDLADFDKLGVNFCAAILRLAAALDRHRGGHIRDIQFIQMGKKCLANLTLRGVHDIKWELYEFGIEKKAFEKVFNVELYTNSQPALPN